MRYIKIIISSLLLAFVIYGLSISIKRGKTSIPPIGGFLNPFSGFWANAERIKQSDEIILNSGVQQDVNILYDERGVPHIYAENMEDLLFGQGYAIAKERLWQMDITTRAMEGTTSEILGEVSLSADMESRRLGIPRAAEVAVKSWAKNEQGMKYIASFCNGINHYISNLSDDEYPLEFKLLGYKPQKWSPFRTALFIKAMAKTLNYRYEDIAYSNALNKLGIDVFNDLYPEYNKKQSPIIQEKKWNPSDTSFRKDVSKYVTEIHKTLLKTDHDPFIGSNNFAVNGNKTASGNPILCNDPHLKLSLPSIWIEMHLVCPDMNAYGVSLPAMPGITLGFNEDIAWGQTNAGHDVLDIYKVKWKDGSKTHYIIDNKEYETEKVIEQFRVKGDKIFNDTVLYTSWGPIRKEQNKDTDLAMRWVSHDSPSPQEIEIYLNINKAKNYASFKEALKTFSAPAQNFIFSSKKGEIAMNVTGNLPIKTSQQGRFIQDGSKSINAWHGFIPFDQLPQELNPSRNYVASANQHSTDQTYPYYYNGGFEDYRGRYINRKLESLKDIKKEDMMNLQLDAHSLKAEEVLPILLANISQDGLSNKEKEIINQLKMWDYNYSINSLAGSYFEKWWDAFYSSTFDEIITLRKEIDLPYPEAFRLVEMLEDSNNHPFFDKQGTEKTESKVDIINESFRSIGFDTLKILPWSDERNTQINHLTNIAAFSSTEINSAGNGNAPNAISKYNGPSWRMIVEMDNPIKAYGIYPGGISGNPGSINYDNFVNDWSAGKYYELNNSSNPSEISAFRTVTIKK